MTRGMCSVGMLLTIASTDMQGAWNFNQLIQRTNQPAAWLKEVLLEIAAQSKRGPNKDLWELKKEYNVKKQGR